MLPRAKPRAAKHLDVHDLGTVFALAPAVHYSLRCSGKVLARVGSLDQETQMAYYEGAKVGVYVHKR